MSTIQPPPPPNKTGDARIDAYLQNLYKWAYIFWFYQTNDGANDSGDGQVIHIPGLDGEPGEDGFTIIGPQGPQGIPGLFIPGMDGQDGEDGFGLPGSAGTTGSMGPMGMPGMDGEDGEDAIPMGVPPSYGPITYTPTITPQTSGSITLDTSADTLQYTKAGRLTNVSGRITVASVSSPVGYMRLSLPHASASITENGDILPVQVVQQGTTTNQDYLAFITGGTDYIQIYARTYASLSTANCANYVQANTEFYVNATYISV